MARPTKYNKAILEKANKYIDDYKNLSEKLEQINDLLDNIEISEK